MEAVLEEIEAGGKPILTVFNKLDRLPEEAEIDEERPWLRLRSQTEQPREENEEDGVGISALMGVGLSPLLQAIERRLEREREIVHIDLPLTAGKILAWLRRNGKVLEEAYSETAVSVSALLSSKTAGQLRKQLAMENSK